MLVITNEGSLRLMQFTLGLADVDAGDFWTVFLYQNDYTPDVTSVLASFTPASFSGSGPFSIDYSLWSSPVTISNQASSSWRPGTPITWTNGSSPQTVYGYVVAVDAPDCSLFAERFSSPFTINNLSTFELSLNFTGATCGLMSASAIARARRTVRAKPNRREE